MNNSHVTRAQADVTMTIAVVGVSCGAVLWGILALCCCRCWKSQNKNTGNNTGTTTFYQVEEVTTYEVGGGANVDFCAEVELEVPQVEVEVELEAPEIEVEIELGAPEIEIEIEVEAEVEVEAEIELDAGVEVELEVEL